MAGDVLLVTVFVSNVDMESLTAAAHGLLVLRLAPLALTTSSLFLLLCLSVCHSLVSVKATTPTVFVLCRSLPHCLNLSIRSFLRSVIREIWTGFRDYLLKIWIVKYDSSVNFLSKWHNMFI